MPMPLHHDPFDTLETVFTVLCAEPSPLALEAGAVLGLPRRAIPLTELRGILLHPSTSHTVRDAALGELLRRAQAEGERWTIGLAGVLLYGLRRAVTPLCIACPGKAADIEAEAIAGVLEAIAVTNPSRRRLASRLTWLARNQAKELVTHEFAETRARPFHDAASAAPAWSDHHPDLVLLKAVIAEVLEPEDAALIGETRLGLMTVSEAAQGLGISTSAAYERRRQAEAKLVAWLVGPDYEAGFLENRANSPYLVRRGRPRNGRTTDRRSAACQQPSNPRR
jgi:hypothetical protein